MQPDRDSRPTRARLVAATAELLQRQGLAASGLSDILARGRAPKGSLYHHFPGGKDELARTAVDHAAAGLAGAITAVADASPDAATAVRRLGALLADGLADSGYERGCPLATVALESTGELAAACARGFASWEAALADAIGGPEAEPLATFVLSALEGALLLARTRRDAGIVRDVSRRLAGLLEEER